MQSSQSLRSNFKWTLFGNVVYAGCQWGFLVVLAKIGSPEMVGQFTLGLAITAPIFMLSNLNLRAVVAPDAGCEYRFVDYLGLRFVTTVAAGLAIAVIGLSGWYHWEVSLVIIAVGLAKSFESMGDIFYGLFQQRERMEIVAKSMMLKGSVSLIALLIGVWSSGTVFMGTLCLAMSWLLVLVVYDYWNGRKLLAEPVPLSDTNRVGADERHRNVLPRWKRDTLKKLVWLALPVGIVMMLSSLATNIPRYFIDRYLGEHQLGLFSAMAYLMIAGNTIIAALGASATPRLAKYYASTELTEFKCLLGKMLLVGVLLGGAGVLLAIVAGRQVLTLFYSSEYAERLDVFLLLMIATAISYAGGFFGTAVTAMRSFKVQVPVHCINIAIILCGSMFLIRQWGLMGAAWTMLIGTAVSTGLYGMIATQQIRVNMKEIS
jgi:O-antigen/teichoic acid export membrane protein